MTRPSLQGRYARNPSESQYPGLWRNLRGLWVPAAGKMGARVPDLSTWRNDGTFGPGTVQVVGDSIRLTGSSTSYIALSNPSRLNPAANSFTAWIRANYVAGADVLFHYGDSSGTPREWALWILLSGVLRLIVSTDSGGFNTSGSTDFSGQWVNIVVRRLGSDWEVYANGRLQTSAIQAGDVTSSNERATIGGQWDGSSYTRSAECDWTHAAIWHRALSLNEIVGLSSGQTPLVRKRRLVVGFVAAGVSSISGTSAGTSTVTGDLKGFGLIDGTAAGASTDTGDLKGFGLIDGTAAGTSTVTGDVVGLSPIDGTSAGTSTVSGDLKGFGLVDGAVAGTSTVTGDLKGFGLIDGATAGTSTVTGDLVAVSTFISGTVAGTSTVAGDLKGFGLIDGTVAGTSTVTGGVGSSAEISGTAAGTSTVTGSLSAVVSVTGAVAGTSTVTGDLKGFGLIDGTAAGTSTVTGFFTVTALISGTVAGTSTVTGTLVDALTVFNYSINVSTGQPNTKSVLSYPSSS